MRPRHPSGGGPLLAALPWLAAPASCAPADGPARAFASRDSAGIAIAESFAPAWSEGEGWRVAGEPEVVIGVTDGDPRYMLAEARGARRLADGRIVVADAGTQLLRIYSATGEHLADLGGEGEGPGEFTRLSHFEASADTIVAYNLFPPRVTRMRVDGEPLGSHRIPAAASSGERWNNLLPFGFLIGAGYGIAMSTFDVMEADFADGINRFPDPLWRFALDGSEAARIGSLPGREVNLQRTERGVRFSIYPFGAGQAVATSSDRIFIADTRRFEILVRDPDFGLRRIVRRSAPARETGPDDLARWIEDWLEANDPPEEEAPEWRAAGEEAAYAPTMPVLRSLTVDAEGHLWAEEWAGSIFRRGGYAVFDADGRWLGRVELPPGRAAGPTFFEEPWIEIGSDYILGVWRNELGVDQVRLYRLEKQ